MRNETRNANRVRRSRWALYECMTGHTRPPRTRPVAGELFHQRGDSMSVATVPVQQATIRQYAKDLKLATVGGQFLSMAEEAVKQKQGHLSYLEALLGAEVEDCYQHGVARRI